MLLRRSNVRETNSWFRVQAATLSRKLAVPLLVQVYEQVHGSRIYFYSPIYIFISVVHVFPIFLGYSIPIYPQLFS